jgi:hypothetical protein
MIEKSNPNQAAQLGKKFLAQALLAWAIVFPPSVIGQEMVFSRDCFWEAEESLVFLASPDCTAMLRTESSSRIHFIQLIQKSAEEAKRLERNASPSTARSLKQLHEKASREAGGWVNGSPYYGAQP